MEAVKVPDTWASIEEFAAWFRANGCPQRVPADARVMWTDVSASMIVFRQGRFQAELYMMKPNIRVPRHHHPMKQRILWVGGWLRAYWEGQPAGVGPLRTKHSGFLSPTLDEGKWHSFKTTERGAVLYVLDDGDTSATIAYEGEPLGPIHAAMLAAR